MCVGGWLDPPTEGRDRYQETREVHNREAEFILFVFASTEPNSVPGTACCGDTWRKVGG